MPAFRFMPRCIALAATLTLGAAWASEHGAPAPKAVPAAPAVAAASASTSAAAPAAPAVEEAPKRPRNEPREVQDPMDMLREKLAKKLGSSKVPEPENPNLVRVVSKASTSELDGHAPAAATLPRAARRKPAAEATHGATAAEAAAHPAH